MLKFDNSKTTWVTPDYHIFNWLEFKYLANNNTLYYPGSSNVYDCYQSRRRSQEQIPQQYHYYHARAHWQGMHAWSCTCLSHNPMIIDRRFEGSSSRVDRPRIRQAEVTGPFPYLYFIAAIYPRLFWLNMEHQLEMSSFFQINHTKSIPYRSESSFSTTPTHLPSTTLRPPPSFTSLQRNEEVARSELDNENSSKFTW